MGLAERKQKQKIGNDPRNLGWSQDQSRFSFVHMQKLGWTPSTGLGTSASTSNPNHIAVVRKLDSSGIGAARALKEGQDLGGGAGEGLEGVLKRLKAQGGGPIIFGDEEEDKGETSAQGAKSEEVKVEPVSILAPVPLRIMASRQKHQKAKRLAASSPAAMAEILGIPLSSLPSSPLSSLPSSRPDSPADTPKPGMGMGPRVTLGGQDENQSKPSFVDEDYKDEKITTATLSVSSYFAQRLLQKRLEREGVITKGAAIPAELALPVRNAEVAKEFEGKKVVFEEEVVGEVSYEEPVVRHGYGGEEEEAEVVKMAEVDGAAEPVVLQVADETAGREKKKGKARKREAEPTELPSSVAEDFNESKKSKKRKLEGSDGSSTETKEERRARKAARMLAKQAKMAEPSGLPAESPVKKEKGKKSKKVKVEAEA